MTFQKKNWQFNDIITEGELNRMEDGIEEGITKAEDAKTNIESHENRQDNPHNVTKQQVGLGNVDNVKQASKAEFDAHLNDKNNPHNVTPEQIGAETPAGAQAKAEAAAGAVQAELDSHKADNVRHITSAERTTWNEKQDALGYTPVNKSGDEMTGILTAHSNTSYTVRQVRNIILSTEDADVNTMRDGDIWIKYK